MTDKQIAKILKDTGLPWSFSHFKEPTEPPFLVYIGNGQNQFHADNTRHWHENLYRVEYYFINKDQSKEDDIEKALLDAGLRFEKSEDSYIETEGVFVIYYYIN